MKLNIGYGNKTTEIVQETKFSGPQTDNNLNWKAHDEYIIHKYINQVQHNLLLGVASLMKTDNISLFTYTLT